MRHRQPRDKQQVHNRLRHRATSRPVGASTSLRSRSTCASAGYQGPCRVQRLRWRQPAEGPAAEISGLEAFLTQYPNSIMKSQALDILMALYQQTGNPKVMDAAKRVLTVNPDNVKRSSCWLQRTRGAEVG